MKSLPQHRRDMIEVLRRIHARGWVSASDGNVSIRLNRERLLTTPTGKHKGYIDGRELILCDLKGRRISGLYEPSSELAMHLAVYEERPDVQAVVHAHPTFCIAFSVAGVTLAQCLLPEVVFTFGGIPTTEYCAPTTEEVPRAIKKLIRDYDALILDRHGSLTIGADIFEAYDKLERMEHVAQITHAARQLGEVRPLSRAQIEQLMGIGRDLGLKPRKVELPCEQCNACAHGHLPQRSPDAPRRPLTWQTAPVHLAAPPAPLHGAPSLPANNAAAERPATSPSAPAAPMPRPATALDAAARTPTAAAGSAPVSSPSRLGCGPVAVHVNPSIDPSVMRIIAEEVARELGR